MVQRTGWRLPKAARVAAWLASIGVGIGLAVACVEQRGSLGDDCLKNQDCLSGICSSLHCAAAPPLFTPAPVADAAADASADGATPGDDSGSSNDATEPVDGSAGDAPVEDVAVPPADGPGEVLDEGAPDAPPDAPFDATADARADAGESG